MAVQLYSSFAEQLINALIATDSEGTGTNRTYYAYSALGSADGVEVNGGSYAPQPIGDAGWSVSTATATNGATFYFPINNTSTAYTASHYLIKRRIGTRNGTGTNTNRVIVYSHAFELGSLTVAQNTRVKINKYRSGLHRGLYISALVVTT